MTYCFHMADTQRYDFPLLIGLAYRSTLPIEVTAVAGDRADGFDAFLSLLHRKRVEQNDTWILCAKDCRCNGVSAANWWTSIRRGRDLDDFNFGISERQKIAFCAAQPPKIFGRLLSACAFED